MKHVRKRTQIRACAKDLAKAVEKGDQERFVQIAQNYPADVYLEAFMKVRDSNALPHRQKR